MSDAFYRHDAELAAGTLMTVREEREAERLDEEITEQVMDEYEHSEYSVRLADLRRAFPDAQLWHLHAIQSAIVEREVATRKEAHRGN